MIKTVITIFFTALIFSCAPLIKKETCQDYYRKLIIESRKDNSYFVRGNIFIHGLYLVFYGNLKEDSSIVVRSPFGKKLFSLLYTKDKMCVELPGKEKICGKDLDIYWDYLNIDIPFDLKQMLTGKFPISENAVFQCSKDGLTVKEKNLTILYKNYRPVNVRYRDFMLLYSYEEGKIKKITVKEKDKELFRVYIREMRKL